MKVLNILVRRCVPFELFDTAVTFHEQLIGQRARMRFDYPAYNLKLAQVASILFIGGNEQALFLIVQDGGLYYHARAMGFEFAEHPA